MERDLTHDSATPQAATPGEPSALFDAIRAQPGDEALWDELEADASTEQQPEAVGALYREALRADLAPDALDRLGQRAVAFHEEWFGEDSPALAEVLERIVDRVPDSEWAFQRLTVAYTVAERWDALLGLYDRVIAGTADSLRRHELLDEAAQVARDFAREPSRAIGYHRQLLAARPDDAGLAGTLEQLLERHGRRDELLAFWEERLPYTPAEQVADQRERIARGHLEWLGRADVALERARPLLAEPESVDAGIALVERIAGEETTVPEVRRAALDLLRRQYEGDERQDDAVAAIERSLDLAVPEERPSLLRDLGERLAQSGRRPEAIDRYASLLQLRPEADEIRVRLRELALEANAPERYVQALEAAGAIETDAARRYALRLETAEARRTLLRDVDGAADAYLGLLEDPALPPEDALPLLRKATELLEATDRTSDHLALLDRLAREEADEGERYAVLGRLAKAAGAEGRADLALDAWGRRLEIDPTDLAALDARVALLEEAGEGAVPQLVDALEGRARGPVPAYRRRGDLVRVAQLRNDVLGDIDGAIATWSTIRQEFGSDRETVEILGQLLAKKERWEDLADLLKETAAADSEHVADMLTALGDTHRERLGRPADSVIFYQGALRLDPTYEPALEGLHEALDDEEARAEAAEILADAYRVTERFPEVVALLEVRLATRRAPEERLRLLREAATFQEREGGDPEAALGSIRRALLLAPDDRTLERELLRLGAAADAWPKAVAGLRDATEATSDADRRAELRFLESKLREERLEAPEDALSGYLEVLGGAPQRVDAARAVVRTALATGALDQAATALLHHLRARGELDPDLLRTLEDVVAGSGLVDRFPQVLESALASEAAERTLPGSVAEALDRLLLGWLEELEEPGDAVLQVLRRLHGRQPMDLGILRELVAAERSRPGLALYAALDRLAQRVPDDIDPLLEAAELADRLEEQQPGLAETAWTMLYLRSTERLRSGLGARGEQTPETCARRALEALLALDEAAGRTAAQVDRLLDASRWPLPAEEGRRLTERAAALAAGLPDREEEALRLYQRLLGEAENRGADPDERLALIAPATAIAERVGLVGDLLELRRRQLDATSDGTERRALRSEVARLAGEIEARYDRRRLLEANLAEAPGDAETLAELRRLLESRGLLGDLADLLEAQATRLVETEGPDPDEAVRLLEEVVGLAEGPLGDDERAFRLRSRLAELRPDGPRLEQLAQLHLDRGEPAAAVRVLERRLADAEARGEPPDQRVSLAERLVDALDLAGEREAALRRLEAAAAAHPERTALRERLAERYRREDRLDRLAELLTSSLDHLDDGDEVLRTAEEAAALFEQVGLPERAVPALERAARRKPDDRALQTRYADALIAAEGWDAAEAQLRRVVETFGRRRSADRAAAHQKLARVLRGRGDLEGALEQLELASSMDVRNAQILGMLAEVAQETGDDGRAERALRALLLVARRRDPDQAGVGMGEVLHGLHRIAARRGQEREAEDLREQAVQAAAQNAAEARRFVRALLPRGEADVVQEVLERRLGQATTDPERAETLAELAAVLDRGLGRTADALRRSLEALELQPGNWATDDAARDYARRVGDVAAYVASLRGRIERARRPGDAALAAELLLRLGPMLERDLGDLPGARQAYEKVEELGIRTAEAWLGLARVYAALGDPGEEHRVLERLVDVGAPAASGGAGPDADDAAAVPRHAWLDAVYRLAESLLTSDVEADRSRGLSLLERGMAVEPRRDRALGVLRRATHDDPNNDALLEAYAPLARTAEDRSVLLDYLGKRSRRRDVRLDELQEGAALAAELDAPERAEAFLERAVEVADASGGPGEALWALEALAERRREAGRPEDAIAYLEAAADAVPEPAEALRFRLAAGEVALDADRLPKAVEIFDGLRQGDPTDPRFYRPELVALRRAGDEEGLVAVVTSTLDALLDPKERNAVRLEHARFLLGREGREPEAADVLRDILGEDPDDTVAGGMLADLFERIGFDEDLAELLERQLDSARGNGVPEDIRSLSLRLGDLYARVRRDDALDVYRRALADLPDDRELATALLGLLGPDDDPRERIEVSERLLATDAGEAAAGLALELADAWRSLEDPVGERRALELGYQRVPESPSVRERLEALFRDTGDHRALADHRAAEGKRLAEAGDPDGAVASFREAARLEAEELERPDAAAGVLSQALALVPTDGALLAELVARRREAGETAAAIADVTGALDGLDPESPARVGLLRLRAALSAELGEEEGRTEDLEAAYRLAPDKVVGDLLAAHETRRAAASAVGDLDEERDASYRLVELFAAHGEPERSREVLACWLDRDPRDLEGLRRLRAVDEASGRTEALAQTLRRLLDVEEGDAQREAGLALAAAWETLGRPEEAREGLELVHGQHPDDEPVRERLRRLYESLGAHPELAGLLLGDAARTDDPEARFILLRRAGELYLQQEDTAVYALEPLEQAAELRPDDHETRLLLVDSLTGAERFADAGRILEQAIAEHPRRRSPELAELQLRMARLAEIAGDRQLQLQWLAAALESDKNNGVVASELARLAMALGDHDTALNALRVVTLAKTEGSMSRAEAFLAQAQIAQERGEVRRALLWARKARSEDPELVAAEVFLQELGES